MSYQTSGFFIEDPDEKRLEEIDALLNEGYTAVFSAGVQYRGKPYMVVYLHKKPLPVARDITATPGQFSLGDFIEHAQSMPPEISGDDFNL